MANNSNNSFRINVAVVSLLIVLALNLATMAYSYGSLSSRVANLEKQLDRQNALLEKYVFPNLVER